MLLPEGVDLPAPATAPLTPLDPRCFHPDEAERRLREHFRVASLEGFGLRGQPLAIAAAGAVLAYLGDNQRAALANVRTSQVYNPSRFLVLDANAAPPPRALRLAARRQHARLAARRDRRHAHGDGLRGCWRAGSGSPCST